MRKRNSWIQIKKVGLIDSLIRDLSDIALLWYLRALYSVRRMPGLLYLYLVTVVYDMVSSPYVILSIFSRSCRSLLHILACLLTKISFLTTQYQDISSLVHMNVIPQEYYV